MESGCGGRSDWEVLEESRRVLVRELRLALRCKAASRKRGIVERWKRELSVEMVGTLLRVMKERPVAERIAAWDY